MTAQDITITGRQSKTVRWREKKIPSPPTPTKKKIKKNPMTADEEDLMVKTYIQKPNDS